MSSSWTPKTEWPELVCRMIKEAKEKIKADRPDLKIEVVPVGTIVTQEFDENRVRIWVDTVAKTPTIG
uniref:Subitilisin-chymotrypsin inhibitor n=1 Tax=Oryza sativa subsp. japonica TaxID=39947 RepID=Q5EII1_ORYSJ|nr:subitilisin-chymotrypsin inhibitor [Oryza sativa Japonica Group]